MIKTQTTTDETMHTSERFTSVTIPVHIQCDGRGLSKSDILRACERLAKSAIRGSRTKKASAVCGKISATCQGDLFFT